jgi:hypothetical protein
LWRSCCLLNFHRDPCSPRRAVSKPLALVASHA